jgi:glucose/arabinose dehydrogenase
MNLFRTLLWTCLLLALGRAAWAQDLDLRLTPVIEDIAQVVDIAHAGDGSGRLFLVRQNGVIRIWDGSQLLADPFLNITAALPSPRQGEQGLLGLAFAPDYAETGRFYINYTDIGGNTRISRLRVSSADPNRADAASEEVILSFSQPFGNHNGGQLAFGPDGMLYVASGDGGGSGDPLGLAQNRASLLGKLLRIDVSGATGYTAPADNPFVDDPDARPEIWALGLRNPWRFAFDPVNGGLYIADVGQNQFEEINYVPAGSPAGLNFGWSIYEGSACFAGNCDPAGLTPPVFEYSQGVQAVIGGKVYRGSLYPQMQGVYFFADFVSGALWGIRGNGPATQYLPQAGATSPAQGVRSFGTDEAGNLYLAAGSVVSLVSDGPPLPASIPIGPAFSGAWFDPEQSGHGIFLEVLAPTQGFPQGRLLAWWFTFDLAGNQAWFGGTGAIEGERAIVDVVQTRGGRWIPDFDPTQVVNDPWGSLLFRFDSCDSGTVEFSSAIGGYGSGSMRLTRLTRLAGLSCP